ncbi:UDP-4-amino-4,6-dideoxy-N-acetyl-beta-L-altrosamine transaminase [Aquicoccus porphyridii]|uniref:UDP-4-amino-4, 6-dideoxy-N-acetyl-beta-L-altrosamine transaminase n=1 Tax=Aquicoccus porphyridii TaxID=1852029 RepID=UPI00273D5A02|nr:UDP-4-amino-4,6-dideoxy-N-acetyl-beta-L-altrosamine transaminase [Aquicoccus porphyridii]
MIPYGRQDITEADLAAVRDVLTSDFITQGPAIAGFEEALAGYCGVRHGVAMNSATSALHVAYMALGLGQGDLLWTSPNTFVATSNAALYCGAEVDFIDIDPDTYNMCLDSLEAKLEVAEKAGRLPKVVTPVHFAGQSCDMARLGALRDRYGFAVVEDASHAVGGSYGGAPVGNCAHSDITIFSFHPVKIITTAEGGMAMTNDDELAAKMAMLRTHGITRDPARMRGEGDGPWYYQQTMLGYNYRITDMQAALGRSQLIRLDSYIDARHARRAVYDRELADLPLKLPYQAEYQHSGLHLYPVLVTDAAPVDRATAFARLREMGIGVNVLYIPVYLQPWYQDLGFRPGHCPNAEDYYRRMITIPMYATLGADDQQTVIDRLRDVFGG